MRRRSASGYLCGAGAASPLLKAVAEVGCETVPGDGSGRVHECEKLADYPDKVVQPATRRGHSLVNSPQADLIASPGQSDLGSGKPSICHMTNFLREPPGVTLTG